MFNQISKSGTNQFHGAGYEYLRNNFFNFRNTFSPSVGLSRWDNFGASIGGPTIRNKMFFYLNVDKIINHGRSYPFSSFPTAAARAGNFSDTGSNKVTSYQNLIYAPPFPKGKKILGRGGLADALVGGWQVSSLFLYQSGNVFTAQMNSNSDNSQANSQYPNVVPGVPLYPANKTAAQWFNPAAFSAPAQYTYGNGGRSILRGPRFSDVDFSASKTLQIPKLERGQLQFRFDATNALSHTSLGIPNSSIGGSTVGQITSAALSGRTLQLGARLSF